MSTNGVPQEDEREPRFGENFNPDDRNRLDVLHKGEPLPQAVNTAREVRGQLKSTVDRTNVETQGWPKCPSDVHSVEDLFTRAKDTVAGRWNSSAKAVIDLKAAQWLKEIPKTRKNAELRKTLADSDLLEKCLGMQDLSAFENIREINPEAWRTLVLASSERQLASVELSRRWVKELPEESLARLGVARDELQLFLDSASLTGKFLDQAYTKQIELADAPGGSVETELGAEPGAKYIYDIQPNPESDKREDKPFKDVFKFEFSKLVHNFEELAKRSEKLLAEGKIPETYRNFPAYLRQMAQVYGSENVNPAELDTMWQDLQASAVKLAKEGCPIMLIPQSCPMASGDAGKVDVEIRLGFQTPETAELSKIIDKSKPIGQGILDEHKDALAKPYEFPPVIVNIQPFAFGPNLHFYTEGQSEREVIMLHANVSAESAAKTRIPLLGKLSNQAGEIDDETFKKSSAVDTAFHEMGHAIFAVEDADVKERLGQGAVDSAVLDELKAETAGIELLLRGLSKDNSEANKKFLKKQLLVKLATVAEYVEQNSNKRGSEGERYYFAGVGVLKALFDAGVLVDRDGKYDITDAEAGFRAIADVGMDIVNKFYLDATEQQFVNTAGPSRLASTWTDASGELHVVVAEPTPVYVNKSVKAFVADLRKQENDPRVAEFIERAKV
jgi:hypothetical protein